MAKRQAGLALMGRSFLLPGSTREVRAPSGKLTHSDVANVAPDQAAFQKDSGAIKWKGGDVSGVKLAGPKGFIWVGASVGTALDHDQPDRGQSAHTTDIHPMQAELE